MKLAMKLLLFLVVVLCLVGLGSAADYYVETSDTTVDGDTFCGGVCDATDTIIIRAGARGGLLFKDFNGSGSYITIMNEDNASNEVVEIDGMSGYGCLSINSSKYLDIRGNNEPAQDYGIKVINDDSSESAGSVWVYGESDHIKLGYLEITCEGNTATGSSGILVSDGDLTSAWIFSTFEIHHNYIHDTRYAGMYLGGNDPLGNNTPYTGTFSIHDNLLEDLGSYGITYKGINGSNNYIYNNTIQGSSSGQSTGIVRTELTGSSKHGIGTQFIYNNNDVEIYNNRIDKTVGPGIKVAEYGQQIHDNIVCGCGSGNEEIYGHGIRVYQNADEIDIYDNIFIQPKRYGIWAGGETSNCADSRNLIGDAGIGERYDGSEGGMVEGTGDNANTYYADVATFGFDEWSDDNDYSNDVFTFTSQESYDNTIMSISPDSVFNDVDYLGAGQIDSDRYYKSWIWFNLSEYNSTDTISVANLSLYWYYNDSGRNKSTNVGIYLSNATTDTDYLTWNNSSNGVAWREPGGNWLDANWADNGTTPFDSVLIPDTAADNSFHIFNLTELVQSIVNESRTNNGFFIIGNETDTNYIAFSSLDNATEAHRPTLNITHAIAGDEAPSASDFGLYKIITINQTMVNQSIGTGIYPLLVSTTDTDLRDHCQADGDDIVFFASDNTSLLPYEQEFWNSTNGELVEHVGVTDVTNVTYIVMYYNNSTIANSENATGVWDSNFVVVQHLNETPAGTTYDSTSNNNDGTTTGMDSADQVAGQIDGSLDFDGADRISLTSLAVDNNAAFTISTWMNGTAGGIAYGEGYSGDDAWAMFLGIDPNSPYSARFYYKESGSWKALTKGTTQVNDTWHHVVLSQASKSSRTIYIDGVAEETDTDAVGDMSTLDTTNIGVLERATFGSYFVGMIDELRISDTARSAEWTGTEYNNTAYPELFISIGAEQGEGAPDTKFEYWTGSAWVDDEAQYYLWFTCFWHTAECANAEQSDGQATLKITNNGTASGTPKMKLNESAPAGIEIYVDDDNTFAGAVELTNTYQAVSTSLNQDTNITLWAWANLSGASAWEFETYAIVE